MRPRRPTVLRVPVALAVLVAGAAVIAPPAATAAPAERRYVVTFTATSVPDGIAPAEAAAELVGATARIDAVARVDAQPLAGRLAVVRSTLAVGELRRLPGVAAVEEDRQLQLAAFGDEPGDGAQWALYNTGGRDQSGTAAGVAGADIAAPDAWTASTGEGVIVAVADTGFQLDHPDLAASVWDNPGETCGSAVDADGNGFAGDCHGWDFGSRDGDPSPPPARINGSDHGTHVAAVVGAPRNGVGLTGVAPDAELMLLKLVDENGTMWLSSAAASIVYAADNGARVYNASWGGINTTSVAMRTAVEHARDEGMLIVAAAGNNGRFLTPVTRYFPSSYSETYDHVVGVAATAASDAIAPYSNRGGVSLAAPGTNILAAVPGGAWRLKTGTSAAAPHVAGVAALVLASEPTLTAAQLKQRLVSTADRPTVLVAAGGGRLNAARAVGVTETPRTTVAAPVPAGPPEAQSQSIRLSWSLPSATDVDHIDLVAMDAAGATAATASVTASATNGTITGLDPSSAYTVQLRTVDADGAFASAVVAATTTTPPVPPANVRLTGTGTAARLEFERSAGITARYIVTANGTTREIAVTRSSPATLAATFGPYTPGTALTAAVTTITTTGEQSAPVTATFTTSDASDAPEATVASGFGTLTVNVTPTAAFAGRLPVTAYLVRVGDRSATVPVAGDGTAAALFRSLLGAHAVTVQALHGPADARLEGVTGTIGSFTPLPTIRPPAPGAVTVTQPVGKVRVTWSSSGPTTTAYEVQLGRFSPVRVPAGQLFFEFANPARAGTYSVAVRAVNQFGKSQSASAVVILPVQPEAVTDVEAVLDDAVEVTWEVPADSWATHFVVRVNGGPARTVRTPRFVMPLPAVGSYTVSVVAMNPYGSSPPSLVTFVRS